MKKKSRILPFKDFISGIIADYCFLVEENKGENFLIGQINTGTNPTAHWLNLHGKTPATPPTFIRIHREKGVDGSPISIDI